MKEITYTHFGLLIAYLLPGFVVIWGISGLWPVAPICPSDSEACATIPSLVGFFNTTLGAITAGMVVSAIRFIMVDTANHLTGLKRPQVDGYVLQQNLGAVDTVIDHHYRHYQFHANLLVAGVIAYGVHLFKTLAFTGLPEVLLIILAIIFWLTARDNLRKYYASLSTFNNNERDDTMSNGMGKHKDEDTTKRNSSQSKKSGTPQTDKQKAAKDKAEKA
jgi:hypothetical protein